jgi:hypothetical protein
MSTLTESEKISINWYFKNFDAFHEFRTTLRRAVRDNDGETLTKLFEKEKDKIRCEINTIDINLSLAISAGYLPVVKAILSSCRELSTSAMSQSMGHGRFDIFAYLYEKGVRVDFNRRLQEFVNNVATNYPGEHYTILEFLEAKGEINLDKFRQDVYWPAVGYDERRATRVKAANKIYFWWAPLLRRINPEFKKRDAEKAWNELVSSCGGFEDESGALVIA